jgi:hypothetical protein
MASLNSETTKLLARREEYEATDRGSVEHNEEEK